MNEPITIERADNLRLSNDAKIRACNFFHAMQKHLGDCDECCLYLYHGDGDLCEAGKTILVRELVYTDMSIELPPNPKIMKPSIP